MSVDSLLLITLKQLKLYGMAQSIDELSSQD